MGKDWERKICILKGRKMKDIVVIRKYFKLFIFLVISYSVVFGSNSKYKQEYVPGDLIVKFTEESNNNDLIVFEKNKQSINIKLHEIDSLNTSYKLSSCKKLYKKKYRNDQILGRDRTYILKFSNKTDMETIAELYRQNPNVEIASPNYIFDINLEPNDTYYKLQWALPKMNMPDAWEITQGNSSVKIAIIDTGVDTDHPDFQSKISALE